MRLPQDVRDQIYELVVLPNVKYRVPTMWLSDDNYLAGPYFDDNHKEEQKQIPTLDNRDGLWLSEWKEQFCYVQGFAEKLHDMRVVGKQAADACLDDFLGFVGERTILEMHNFNNKIRNDYYGYQPEIPVSFQTCQSAEDMPFSISLLMTMSVLHGLNVSKDITITSDT